MDTNYPATNKFQWTYSDEKFNSMNNLINKINEINSLDDKKQFIKKYFNDYGLPSMRNEERNILRKNKFLADTIELYQEEIKKTRQIIYNENKYICDKFTEKIVNEVVIEIIKKIHGDDPNLQSTLYGTKALQLFGPNKWVKLASDLDTVDIDIAVNNPRIFIECIFTYLCEYAKTNIFEIDGKSFCIWKIDCIPKNDINMYTISIRIGVKINDGFYIYSKNSICDITQFNEYNKYGEYDFLIGIEQLRCQTPYHYICGLVEKLYNTYINPRIITTGRSKILADATIIKLKKLMHQENLIGNHCLGNFQGKDNLIKN